MTKKKLKQIPLNVVIGRVDRYISLFVSIVHVVLSQLYA